MGKKTRIVYSKRTEEPSTDSRLKMGLTRHLRENYYFVTTGLATRLTDSQVDDFCGTIWDKNKKRHAATLAHPADVQIRCMRLNQYFRNLPQREDIIEKMHSILRIAYPSFAEVYDSMPARLIDKADVLGIYNRYMQATIWGDVSPYIATAAALGGFEEYMPVIQYIEYQRANELKEGHPYFKELMNGDCLPKYLKAAQEFRPINGNSFECSSHEKIIEVGANLLDVIQRYGKNVDEETCADYLSGDCSFPAIFLWSLLCADENGLKRPVSLTMRKDLMPKVFNKITHLARMILHEDCENMMCGFLEYCSFYNMPFIELVHTSILAEWLGMPISDVIIFTCMAHAYADTLTEKEDMQRRLFANQVTIDKTNERESKLREQITNCNRQLQEHRDNSRREKSELLKRKDAEIEKVKKELRECAAQKHELQIELNNTKNRLKTSTDKEVKPVVIVEKQIDEEAVDLLKQELASSESVTRYLAGELAALQQTVNGLTEKLSAEPDEPEDSEETDGNYTCIENANIVIVGGHERWSYNMQAHFPNVKYIGNGYKGFDTCLIKTAECVWVQSHHMPHTIYDKVVAAARKYSIPVRYFTTNGTSSCVNEIKAYIEDCKKANKPLTEDY